MRSAARRGRRRLISEIVVALKSRPERATGEHWQACEEQRDLIEKLLGSGVRLLDRPASRPYSTQHRYSSNELGFHHEPPTILIVDGESGTELQVDTGCTTTLIADSSGRRLSTSANTRRRSKDLPM
jgi:hypothetical protein